MFVYIYETISTNIWWYLCLKINWSLYKNILFILIIFMFLHCYHISIGRNRNLWSSSVFSVFLGLFRFDPLYVTLNGVRVEYVHRSNGSNNGSHPVYHHVFDKRVPCTTIFQWCGQYWIEITTRKVESCKDKHWCLFGFM